MDFLLMNHHFFYVILWMLSPRIFIFKKNLYLIYYVKILYIVLTFSKSNSGQLLAIKVWKEMDFL